MKSGQNYQYVCSIDRNNLPHICNKMKTEQKNESLKKSMTHC